MPILRTTKHHIRRSPYQALAAIILVALTFLVITLFTFLTVGSHVLIRFLESKPQVTAFFKDEAKQENIDALKEQLQSSGKVSKMRFVSKQEALGIYKDMFKSDPILLELVTADVLPPSLEIATVNLEDLAPISETLKNSSIVQEVIFQKDVVGKLTEITNAIRRIGLGLIIILSAVSMFIMTTIIGIKISQKKEEIEILRLIGATSWYIRWPFILEGVFYGVVGAFIGWLLASGILWYSMPFLSGAFRGIPILSIPPIFLLAILGGELLLAMLLGIFSSFTAVLRYLK